MGLTIALFLVQEFKHQGNTIRSLRLFYTRTMKSCNYESQNNELSWCNEDRVADSLMLVPIEKYRYNQLSHNNEVNGVDVDPI